MKKFLALLLVLAMLLTFAACKSNNIEEKTTITTEKETKVTEKELPGENAELGSLAILTTAWSSWSGEKFAAMGGDTSNPKEDAPGAYNIKDENLCATLVFPEDKISKIDEAASLVHAMNANTFTAGAFHVKDYEAFNLAHDIKETALKHQWMCGIPERFVVFVIGDYVVTLFGAQDFVDNFENALLINYEGAVLAVDEIIV